MDKLDKYELENRLEYLEDKISVLKQEGIYRGDSYYQDMLMERDSIKEELQNFPLTNYEY